MIFGIKHAAFQNLHLAACYFTYLGNYLHFNTNHSTRTVRQKLLIGE
jgi:hypothetical protein